MWLCTEQFEDTDKNQKINSKYIFWKTSKTVVIISLMFPTSCCFVNVVQLLLTYPLLAQKYFTELEAIV